jgi:chitin disaccharide deacetylase
MDASPGPTAVTPAEQSSELLGYPPDARLLIVNCDDFGMYPAINAAVIESIEEGIATSCSLIVPCPAAPQAMELLSRRPQIPFGIHLTLVCEMRDISFSAANDDTAGIGVTPPASPGRGRSGRPSSPSDRGLMP